MNRIQETVVWRATEDARHPYEALVGGQLWRVRINDFPEEPSLYTLFVGEVATDELLSWPSAWSRPESETAEGRLADPVERAEYLLELEHFERTRDLPPSKLVE